MRRIASGFASAATAISAAVLAPSAMRVNTSNSTPAASVNVFQAPNTSAISGIGDGIAFVLLGIALLVDCIYNAREDGNKSEIEYKIAGLSPSLTFARFLLTLVRRPHRMAAQPGNFNPDTIRAERERQNQLLLDRMRAEYPAACARLADRGIDPDPVIANDYAGNPMTVGGFY